jgi:hypothetical protein
VTLGALFGELRSITSGISADDRIVVNGQMHARPGSTVNPTEVPIKVDANAFSDPESDALGMSDSTAASAADANSLSSNSVNATASASAQLIPSARSAKETRQ